MDHHPVLPLQKHVLVGLIQTQSVPLILSVLLLKLEMMVKNVLYNFALILAHQEFHLALVPRTLMVAPPDQTLAVHLPKSYLLKDK